LRAAPDAATILGMKLARGVISRQPPQPPNARRQPSFDDPIYAAVPKPLDPWRVRGVDAPGGYIVSLMTNDAFKALAHPLRRGIVERLAHGPASIGKATGGFGVSKPTISRHVKVLEDAGVVARTIDGRTHQLSLSLEALAEAVDWIDRQRAIWERMLDVVDELLAEQNKAG
jgi:DNA-binding transcriptional ArsR family regulator